MKFSPEEIAQITDAVRLALREELGEADDQYLSVARAAKVCEVSPATIREWISSGRLKRYTAGRELRVRRGDLDALLASAGEPEDDSPEAAARALIEGGR